jgi:hypothetical protein
MPRRPRDPEDDPQISSVLILLDTLSPAERRGLANALLRAAWSAALEGTRILLLDLLIEVDAHALGGATWVTVLCHSKTCGPSRRPWPRFRRSGAFSPRGRTGHDGS